MYVLIQLHMILNLNLEHHFSSIYILKEVVLKKANKQKKNKKTTWGQKKISVRGRTVSPEIGNYICSDPSGSSASLCLWVIFVLVLDQVT